MNDNNFDTVIKILDDMSDLIDKLKVSTQKGIQLCNELPKHIFTHTDIFPHVCNSNKIIESGRRTMVKCSICGRIH